MLVQLCRARGAAFVLLFTFLGSALHAQPTNFQQVGVVANPRPKDWRPNVLLILVDQFNARMLGHEDNGYGGVANSLTPNLDSLAAGGVRFSNATCVAAVCQASRYSILTGRWPYHHGVRINQIWEPRTETTFAELARAAGLKTANFGLHHLMWDNQRPGWGDDHGFDEILDLGEYSTFCFQNGQQPYTAPSVTTLMPGLPVFGDFEYTGFTSNKNEYHPTGYFTDKVIKYLNERAGPQGDGKPFVCWYSILAPHPPMLPSGVAPDDYAHMFHPFTQLALPPNYNKVSTTNRLSFVQQQFMNLSDDQMREALSYYYALIAQLDENIGRVLDELEQLGIADDTIVVFTSDHGEMAAQMKSWTKGAGIYDALTRVPLLMRLPGVLPAGKTVSEPVLNIDIFPTLVEATGVPLSDKVREAVDGESLMKLMIEPTAPPGWRQESFHALGTSNANVGHQFMARTQTAKYALDDWGTAEEYYDLVNDPWEIDNLIGSADPGVQAAIADLKSRFTNWWNNEQGHAPHYRVIGAWTAKPVAPEKPVPADAAVGVARDVDMKWVPCSGSALQPFYFGTNAASVPLIGQLQHMENSFNPGTLEPATTYYWRVDQVNANGVTAGPLWSFTTTAEGPGGPGLVTAPAPAHLAASVPVSTPLSWSVAPGTQTLDVYMGLAGHLQQVAAGLPATTTSWDPGTLLGGEEYEWRIDSRDANGLTEGTLWKLSVSPVGLAQKARVLLPEHCQSGVLDGQKLIWEAGAGAISHNVYFGTSFPLPFQANTATTWWSPGQLPAGLTYYWRIDEVNATGVTRGFTSRFRR